MNDERFYHQLSKGILLFVAGLIFLRFFPALWGALGVGLVVMVVVSLAYLVVHKLVRRNNQLKALGTFAGQVEARIAESKKRADGYRNEAATILNSRQELIQQLAKTPDATQAAKAKGERLLRELDEEQALRLSKASFFEDSLVQLQRLLEQHRLHETLLAKEAELDELRSQNFDDIAEMENLRYQLEQDQVRLETISELTHRAAGSPSLNQTELLREELAALRL